MDTSDDDNMKKKKVVRHEDGEVAQLKKDLAEKNRELKKLE